MSQFMFKGHLVENSVLFGGNHCLALLRPSTDGMRLPHILEGNLLYSKSTDLNVHLWSSHCGRVGQESNGSGSDCCGDTGLIPGLVQ